MIPSESKWYPTEYQHPDFYVAGDLKVEMAVQAGGSVQPETVAQTNWAEDALLPVVWKALKINLEEGDDVSAFRILNFLMRLVERLGEGWDIERVVGIAERVEQVVGPFAFSEDGAASDSGRWRLGLVEHLCLLPTMGLLGVVKGLGHAKLADIRKSFASVKWNRPETLYRARFPRFALPTLEWFRPRMGFEVLAEGQEITPRWLAEQAVVKDYLTALNASVDLLLNANQRLYRAWHMKALDAKHPWAAAVVLNRQGEFIGKLQHHFHKITAAEADYEGSKVLSDLLGWPPKQTPAFQDRLVAIEREYELAVAGAARSLIRAERRSQVPDFGGEFLSRTAQTVLAAICKSDVTVFRSVFPLFFQASLEKTMHLFGLGAASNETERLQRWNAAAGPLLDLLELSGYTIVVSELRQASELWDVTRGLWDLYLGDQTNGPTRIQFLIATLQLADVPALFAPGELLRTGWRMEIQSLLAEVPIEEFASGSAPFGIHTDHRARHPSGLIRVLARDGVPGFYRGIDVFVSMYLVNFPGSESAFQEVRSRDLADAIRREARRRINERNVSDGEEVDE